MSRYEKLPDHSIHTPSKDDENDIELASSRQPAISTSKETTFRLRILHKEAVIEVTNLSSNSSVMNLKAEIEKAASITPENQRLIFSGRALKPDEALLSSFNIVNESSVHLFPKPPNIPSSSSTNTTTITGIPSVQSNFPSAINRPSMLDTNMENISQSASEVRLWSSILIFLSVMTLFDNFNRVVSSGNLWRCSCPFFDSTIVFFMNYRDVW
jgi:hypothetical protein